MDRRKTAGRRQVGRQVRETGRKGGRRRQVGRETHRHSRTRKGTPAAMLAQIQQAPLLLQFPGTVSSIQRPALCVQRSVFACLFHGVTMMVSPFVVLSVGMRWSCKPLYVEKGGSSSLSACRLLDAAAGCMHCGRIGRRFAIVRRSGGIGHGCVSGGGLPGIVLDYRAVRCMGRVRMCCSVVHGMVEPFTKIISVVRLVRCLPYLSEPCVGECRSEDAQGDAQHTPRILLEVPVHAAMRHVRYATRKITYG